MRSRVATSWDFASRAWRLASPFWRSEERWRARALLTVIVVLTLALVGLTVLYNDWSRAFFEALQNKDFESFGPLLLRFAVLAGLYIVGAVFRRYFTLMLQMRWRIWLTRRYLDRWLTNQAYYRLEVTDDRTDNPDQRIADDLRLFTSDTLDLTLGLLSSAVTLASFVAILWTISGSVTFPIGPATIEIPGYMVWVAVLYALAGSWLTHVVGRPLIGLNFSQQRFEADFRFGLVRLRENAEGVALYHGEAVEQSDLLGRFERIRANWWQLMRYTKNLTFLTVGYDQLAGVFPLLVAAPRYFVGAITLGVLSQIANAFGRVQGSLSWFIESYSSLASLKATVDRLLTFQDALESAAAETSRGQGIHVESNGQGAVRMDHVEIGLPDGHLLLPNVNLTIDAGNRILITGPSGSGKTTLFRALAGIWPFGRGLVEVPRRARLLFLPQRPYMPVASLREALAYPGPASTFDDAAVREALRATGLGEFAHRLDEVQNWSMQLSGGEQQRLSVARAVLQNPDWLFLDEATSALDGASQNELYALLGRCLPNAAIVSIAHRPELGAFHETHLSLVTDANGTALTRVSRD